MFLVFSRVHECIRGAGFEMHTRNVDLSYLDPVNSVSFSGLINLFPFRIKMAYLRTKLTCKFLSLAFVRAFISKTRSLLLRL